METYCNSCLSHSESTPGIGRKIGRFSNPLAAGFQLSYSRIMSRFVIAILLNSSLLVCPMRCMSCQAGAVLVDHGRPVGCSCCQREAESPNSKSSEQCPGEDCTCQNCICEGATLQGFFKLPIACTMSIGFLHRAAEIERGNRGALVQELARETQDCTCHGCGRDARIVQHSWLV